MKTLTLYFLKRWWGFYLVIFLIDVVLAGASDPVDFMTPFRGMITLICLLLFSNYLQKGGSGAFWVPLTRKQIGYVYWLIAVVVPTLIFGTSELIGGWVSAIKGVPAIWLVFKHSLFFMGIASVLILSNSIAGLFLLGLVIFNSKWSGFFLADKQVIESIGFIASIFLIVAAFLRVEYFLEKQVLSSNPETGSNKFFQPFGKLFVRSKRTGMMWILETAFWNVFRSYLFIIVFIILLTLFPSFAHFDSENPFGILLPLLAVGLIPAAEPIGLLISNLRVARTLPFTTNQLAGWLIGLTFGTAIFLGLLILPITFFLKLPFETVLLTFLIGLESILVLQTVALFVSASGLRSIAAITSALMLIGLVISIFLGLKLFTEFRLSISILISVPIAFFIHRACLKKGSALYRPKKETQRTF